MKFFKLFICTHSINYYHVCKLIFKIIYTLLFVICYAITLFVSLGRGILSNKGYDIRWRNIFCRKLASLPHVSRMWRLERCINLLWTALSDIGKWSVIVILLSFSCEQYTSKPAHQILLNKLFYLLIPSAFKIIFPTDPYIYAD